MWNATVGMYLYLLLFLLFNAALYIVLFHWARHSKRLYTTAAVTATVTATLACFFVIQSVMLTGGSLPPFNVTTQVKFDVNTVLSIFAVGREPKILIEGVGGVRDVQIALLQRAAHAACRMTPADPHHRAGDADEGLWVEAIIGNDRVARWIDGIHAG